MNRYNKKQYDKERYIIQKQSILEKQKIYKELNKDKYLNQKKSYFRMKSYGMTEKTYNQMLIDQNNVCFICLKPETLIRLGRVTALSVDHNHSTGQIRKLLCHNCNVSIGYLKENPQTARAVAKYLEDHLE